MRSPRSLLTIMSKVVVIAASTGGLEPLRALASRLPIPCAASIFVVWHLGPHPSTLPAILSSASELPARFARDNALVERGHIYVAPPDHHLLLMAERMHLSRGPKINHTRPAADPLFASAAKVYEGQVLGIVLSGEDGDGAEGLRLVKKERRHGPRPASRYSSKPLDAAQGSDD